MKTFSKFLFIIIALQIIFLNTNTIYSYANSDNYISLDYENKDKLPKNFRTSEELSNLENENINFSGLSTLNISGSSQFTESSLLKIKKTINSDFPLYIIDLRQESHGFINGNAVSLFEAGNKINATLPLNAVLKREELFLKSIPLNRTILLNNNEFKIIPKTIYNEEDAAKKNNANYFRIPVTDNERPTDEMIDRFITFTKSLPEDRWIHFHCKEGIGRTTTFMIFYDIMNNYKDVSFDSIISRQTSLDSINLLNFEKKDRRFLVLENFYKYAQDTNFTTSWQEWVKSNNIEPFTLADEKK